MAEGNGSGALHDPDDTLFEIGNEKIWVPPLVWYNLRRLEPFLREKRDKPDVENNEVIETALTILAEALVLSRPECDKEYLEKRIRGNQIVKLFQSHAELLAKSGFTTGGEAAVGEGEAASPGTGTLNGSSPSAPQEISTEEIGSESSAA